MAPCALLFLLPLAQADVLHATLAWEGSDLVLVGAKVTPGDVQVDPGDLQVLDAHGAVLTTAALPGLPPFRAVITPEGHEVGHTPPRFVRVELPWPETAVELQVTGRPLGVARALTSPLRPMAAPPPGEVVKIRESGPSDRMTDLFIIADGYPATDRDRFLEHVNLMVDELATIPPYADYLHLVNIWAGFYPSADSGIDLEQPPDGIGGEGTVDTPFDCHYGCDGQFRLICCDEADIVSTTDRDLPEADGVLVMVNDRTNYGGSGGLEYAATYIGTEGPLVAAHELGHHLILLWDEYTYGSDVTGDPEDFVSRNCVPTGEPPPWSHWIDDEHPEVGSYPGCSFANWSRPTRSGCLMNALQPGFCPVCREQVVRTLYRKLAGRFVRSESPARGTAITLTEGQTQDFSVDVYAPPAGVEITWEYDGEVIGAGATYTLDGCGARDGDLRAVVRDRTDWVRSDPIGLLVGTVTWPVSTARCEGDPPPGCRCDTPSRPAFGLGLLLALAAARRRR